MSCVPVGCGLGLVVHLSLACAPHCGVSVGLVGAAVESVKLCTVGTCLTIGPPPRVALLVGGSAPRARSGSSRSFGSGSYSYHYIFFDREPWNN